MVEIQELLALPLVFEEGFVRSDHLGILVESLPNARAQADKTLDAIRRQKRIAQNLLGLLADAIYSTSPLDQADDGPRQIEIHDDRCVLQVLTFTQHVC